MLKWYTCTYTFICYNVRKEGSLSRTNYIIAYSPSSPDPIFVQGISVPIKACAPHVECLVLIIKPSRSY